MATYTNNLNLEKPDKTEQYSIDVFNANADKIDNFAGLTPPNALTADKLTIGKNINGVLFDGSNDIISGLGLYSATQTYNSTNIVYDYINLELKLFKSKKDKNIGNPLSSTEFWEEVSLGGSGHELFDVVLKDKVLTFTESFGFAQLGSYVYKEAIAGSRYGYADFYNKCVQEYNEATTTETINGITVKVNQNGHKFYNIADKSAIDTFYSSYGMAWFYGVDTENERILLPRNDYYFKNGSADNVGDIVEAGLPNLTGFAEGVSAGALSASGVFYSEGSSYVGPNSAVNYDNPRLGVDFSRSSEVYGNSDTVQPPSVNLIPYMVVGNTVADTSWVDVVTQVEGGVKDLEDATNEGLQALSNASNALRQNQITNCLLEVPQRIKYTLENGTLTIKAGTQLIVPNGFEADGVTPKFDYYTLETDRVEGSDFGYDSKHVLCINADNTGFFNPQIEICFSGTTAPTGNQYALWYDTANNKMKWTANSGASWVEGLISLPILTGYMSNKSVWTSVDEVFNGIGCFGSHWWVDKDVKGLIPNGRNTDGTLNNIERITDKVYIEQCAGSNGFWFMMTGFDGSFRNAQKSSHYEQAQRPVPIGNYATWYNPIENKLYFYNVGVWVEADYAIIGETTVSNDVVTSMQSKQPFRALDYSDFINSPHIVETYKNGTSWYRVWSDGWCEQGGLSSESGSSKFTIKLLKEYANTNYNIQCTYISTHSNAVAASVLGVYGEVKTSSFAVWNNTSAYYSSGRYWKTEGYIK